MDTFLVTRKIAWGVPQYEGFTFTDPFDVPPEPGHLVSGPGE